jgi:outer membrane protein OmpA-like peptidoglycan-associated protein
VACRAEQAAASPGEVVRFTASGSDPDGDALSYSWTASAGRITGAESASLDTTGVTASSVSATVRCSDGRGGTAEATCSVRLDAVKPPPPATTSCESSGFPRNLARLNNVDKACLDDLASRLRQDPRSRVIVIGHADAGERLPEVLARKRAEAAKQYLVGERQIEASRISVRSAASSHPADTGTSVQARSRNRRIELIFVPEGATAPEPD